MIDKSKLQPKDIDLYRLRELVEGFYGFDISNMGRSQDLVYAKKVFSKLARDRNHTYQAIGDSIRHNHATIVHHYNTFDVVLEHDMDVYNKCISVYDMLPNLTDEALSIKIFANAPDDIIKAKYEVLVSELKEEIIELRKQSTSTSSSLKPIISIISDFTTQQTEDFIEYRLKPYASSLKN